MESSKPNPAETEVDRFDQDTLQEVIELIRLIDDAHEGEMDTLGGLVLQLSSYDPALVRHAKNTVRFGAEATNQPDTEIMKDK